MVRDFDIIKHYDKVSADLVEKFSKFDESASIHECMGRQNAFGGAVKPVWPGMRACGPALTVECRPGDNLIIHKAISMIKPGDVLVISYKGDTRTGGMWGGLMSASAQAMGAAGMITDGAVRDSMTIKKLNFPVFSQKIGVEGTTKSFGGKTNHPGTMCGVTIRPGGRVFGDNDDVVAVPKEIAAEVYEETYARERHEDEVMARIQNHEGTTYDINGNDKKLAALIETGEVTEEPDA